MIIKGNAARFLNPDTDTDIIIPARFLKRTALTGFEQFAFFEKRYLSSTVCEPSIQARDFVFTRKDINPECGINHPNSKDASVLLTWANFGCGSSREHAVYALRQFKVIIGSAPEGKSAFADIFRDNCRQNLIWTPVISAADHGKLNAWLEAKLSNSAAEISLDTDADVLLADNGALKISFTIPAHHKSYILNGKEPMAIAEDSIRSSLSAVSQWETKNASVLSSFPSSAL